LKKDICTNNDLTSEGLAAYIALRYLLKEGIDEYYISLNMLAFILSGEFKRKTIDSIKLGVSNLIDIKLIRIVNKISTTEYILDLSDLYLDISKNYYIKIDSNEVKKIMDYKYKFLLLRYFVLLLSMFNHKHKLNGIHQLDFSSISIDSMVSQFNMPRSNILSYNQILEEKKILYIHRFNDYIKSDDGSIKSIQNFYSRLEQKDLIISYANQYANALKSEKCNKRTNKQIANKKNSMLQKFNALDKGTSYSNDIIQEIYNFIVEYNADQDKVINMYKNDKSDYADEQRDKARKKKKDLSVFDGYGFLVSCNLQPNNGNDIDFYKEMGDLDEYFRF
jgi:hypothetical protein